MSLCFSKDLPYNLANKIASAQLNEQILLSVFSVMPQALHATILFTNQADGMHLGFNVFSAGIHSWAGHLHSL